jgi:AcrR family transcriptional regulator
MSTPKSRREEFSEATRNALLDAATKRFGEVGYAGTALEDVAADIRASRGAVYHHFSSKRALFEAVFARLEISAVDRAAKAGARGRNAWESALLALDEFLDQCCDPVYGRIVWQEAPLALGWAHWIEEEQKYAYGLVEQFVRDLLDNDFLTPVPVETTAQLSFNMLGAAGQALATTPQSERQRVKAEYREVIGLLLAGLRKQTDRGGSSSTMSTRA